MRFSRLRSKSMHPGQLVSCLSDSPHGCILSLMGRRRTNYMVSHGDIMFRVHWRMLCLGGMVFGKLFQIPLEWWCYVRDVVKSIMFVILIG